MKTQRAVSFDESSMESCTTMLQEEHQHHQQHQQQQHQHQQQQQQQHRRYGRDSCESCESYESRESCRDNGCNRDRGSESNQEVTSLEEAKTVIAALKARQRAQAHQMLAWRRTLKLQEELVARLTREKAEQLRSLSSQLLLFESRLCRKQKEIEANLAQREAIILRQQRVIRQLQNKLRLANESKNNNNNNEGGGSDTGGNGTGTTQVNVTNTRDYSPPCDALDRLDSLGDSDSAVVLEEAFLDDPTPPRFRSNITDITVIRSVSDAVEPINNKYCSSTRRCNGFLRRPEVLETVYSVEEDGDGDRADNEEEEADEEDNNDESIEATNKAKNQQSSIGDKTRLREFYGSFERLAQQDEQEHMAATTAAAGQNTTNYTSKSGVGHNAQRTRDESQQAQVTYNRVMSNHRSVTKPKDVKYKRINKAKSKSLEELRGRLRNWVEKGNKIAISLDQSYA